MCDNTVIKKQFDKEWNIIEEITKPYTITWLALYLDVSYNTLKNYTEKEEFFKTVLKARTIVLNNMEENALTNKTNTTFTIFSCKNWYWMTDRQDLNVNWEIKHRQELSNEQAWVIATRMLEKMKKDEEWWEIIEMEEE